MLKHRDVMLKIQKWSYNIFMMFQHFAHNIFLLMFEFCTIAQCTHLCFVNTASPLFLDTIFLTLELHIFAL